MTNPQLLEVYCPNIRCGDERWSSTSTTPLKARQHRRMKYMGCRKVGLAALALRSVFDLGESIEMGTYHFYACTVCGEEVAYLEKRGTIRRVE